MSNRAGSITTTGLIRELPHRSVRSLVRIAALAERMIAERRAKRETTWQLQEQDWRIHAVVHARPRQRIRWYCDFCQKGFWTRPEAEKHNRRCTLNPLRICGFCIASELPQQPLTTLMTVLSQGKLDHGVSELRDLAGSCPACMYAALRQSSVTWNGLFNFKAERAKFLQMQEVVQLLDCESSCDDHILRKERFKHAMEAAIKRGKGKAA
jgi:hypothetical protein